MNGISYTPGLESGGQGSSFLQMSCFMLFEVKATTLTLKGFSFLWSFSNKLGKYSIATFFISSLFGHSSSLLLIDREAFTLEIILDIMFCLKPLCCAISLIKSNSF